MPLTRRHVLAGMGALVVTSCAPGPEVNEPSAETPKPTQDPGVSALSTAVSELSRAITLQEDPWRSAALAQAGAWQARLLAADPLTGGEAIFPESSPSPSPSAGSSVTPAVQLVSEAATEALSGTEDQPMRLFHLSILLGVTGLADLNSLPAETTDEPTRYPAVAADAALGVALSHVWALLQAIEKGLGVIPAKDPEHEALLARHTGLKGLRDRLIAALGANRPRQDGHYDVPAVTDTASVRAARAELELRLLDGLAGVVAATGTTGEEDWLADATAQVVQVQGQGGRLPRWPGWVKS